jgi:hypothetical protein
MRKLLWILLLVIPISIIEPPTFNQKIVKGPLPWPAIDGK